MKSANNYKNMARFLLKMFSTITTFTNTSLSTAEKMTQSQFHKVCRWSSKVKSILEFQDEMKIY